jgi:hypothetical protein
MLEFDTIGNNPIEIAEMCFLRTVAGDRLIDKKPNKGRN